MDLTVGSGESGPDCGGVERVDLTVGSGESGPDCGEGGAVLADVTMYSTCLHTYIHVCIVIHGVPWGARKKCAYPS